jgi:hypothetical protein
MSKAKIHHTCTVERYYRQSEGVIDLKTSEYRETGQTWVTGPCSTPLFSAFEKSTGVCRHCASGYSEDDNGFASQEEMDRATSAY